MGGVCYMEINAESRKFGWGGGVYPTTSCSVVVSAVIRPLYESLHRLD
jgi:hypothetical protein